MKVFNKTALATLLVVSLLSIGFSLSPGQLALEQTTGLQWLFRLRGPVSPPKELAIVALNNAAADALALPSQVVRWPRTVYGDLVTTLTQQGASVIVMDIAFKEAKGPEDQHFARALNDTGNVILFKYLKRNQSPLANGDGIFGTLDIQQEVYPLALLAKPALAVGSFTLTKNPGTVVKAPTYMALSTGVEPSQPLLALLAYYRDQLPRLTEIIYSTEPTLKPPAANASLNTLAQYFAIHFHQHPRLAQKLKRVVDEIADANTRERLQRLIAALSQTNGIYINFYGPDRTLKTLNLDQLLQREPERLPDLNNTMVFVGFSENAQTEQKDFYRTVFSQANGIDLSGVEISATTFVNLLHNQWISPLATGVTLAINLLAIGLGFFSLLILPMRWTLLMQAVLIISYTFLALHFFSAQHLWLPLLTPLLGLSIANGCALYLRYRYNRQRHQHIETALAHYLPAPMAKQLSQNVEHLEQQHQLVQGVCLMTDIHGYTSVSEQLSPTELHKQLNRYYETLIDAVNQHGGSVANIVGDSLLAIWTAPTLNADICRQATDAAKAIANAIDELSDDMVKLPTSVALHGGEFSLGNLGAKTHFEYSPVGDIVNTTARIEHLNRDLGTQILCTTPIKTQLSTGECRYLGQFNLRNKASAVAIFELDSQRITDPQQLTHFSDALEHFEQQQIPKAKVLFTEYTHLYPNDPAGTYYLNRCMNEK